MEDTTDSPCRGERVSTLASCEPAVVVRLAYDVPEFLQRHITEHGWPLGIWQMVELVRDRFKVSMTFDQLWEMLRCAGVAMRLDSVEGLQFAGFSPAYEVLSAARKITQLHRPKVKLVHENKSGDTQVTRYLMVLKLQEWLDQKLETGQKTLLRTAIKEVARTYPELIEIKPNWISRELIALGRYETAWTMVAGKSQRVLRRIA